MLKCDVSNCGADAPVGITLIVGQNIPAGTKTDYNHWFFCADCTPVEPNQGVMAAADTKMWPMIEADLREYIPAGWELLEVDTGDQEF